jgi:hypothetical protein
MRLSMLHTRLQQFRLAGRTDAPMCAAFCLRRAVVRVELSVTSRAPWP